MYDQKQILNEEQETVSRANEVSSVNFDYSNRSQALLIDPRDNSDKTKNEYLEELNKLDNPDDSFDEDQVKYLISDKLKEASSNDFGYLTFYHTGNETPEGEIKNEKSRIKKESEVKEEVKFYKPGNLLNQFSKRKHKSSVNNPLKLFLHFAKKPDTFVNKLNIENPYAVRSRRERLNNVLSKKTTNRNPSAKNENEDDDLIKNTQNSRIQTVQRAEMIKGRHENAIQKNFEYIVRKAKYECELIENQLVKFRQYLKSSGKKQVFITDPRPFIDLMKNSTTLMKNFRHFEHCQNLRNPDARSRLEQFSMEARSLLIDFMAGIIQYYEKYLVERRAANDNVRCYIKWKTKLSQIVGIWDLSNSNGTEIKASYKYLILKRFLTLRALARQSDKDFIIMPEEKKSIVKEGFFKKFFCSSKRNVNIHPIEVFLHNDKIRYIKEFLVAFMLLYSFITVPLRLFLGNETKTFKLFEKFVDMYFYIDIMLTFRTAFKDKFNSDVYDIREIAIKYLNTFFFIDFISTIPWYFFTIGSAYAEYLKVITHVLKIGRIFKLLPILNRFEQIKGANYYRLLKLLLIYFLMIHWMACLIVYGITKSIDYNLMNTKCYLSNIDINKFTLTENCKYVISTYHAAYMIPGQYPNYLSAYSSLATSSEYVLLILEYLMGMFVSGFIFGSITSIIQNLDQGSNFYTEKTDLLREHMLFYDIGTDVQNDVKVYYNYLWQRHKDIIYGKDHFNLLSKSLREKFENMNLVGSEIYLHTFHKLKNRKLIGAIIREFKKKIVFPYEILYEEGSMVSGMYILTNGNIMFSTVKLQNISTSESSVEYAKVIKHLEEVKKMPFKVFDETAKDMCVIFPLVSIFIKTGRTYQRSYSTDFADVLFLPLKAFDSIITSFPVEMHSLKHEVMHEVERTKIFENAEIFKTLSLHSARSIGKNYEKEYTKVNIWIPIPIPISQRKISSSYTDSFVKKIRNLWREILISSDMNICLNSFLIIGFLKINKQIHNKKEDNGEKNILLQHNDQLDVLKNLSKNLTVLTEEFLYMKRQIALMDQD